MQLHWSIIGTFDDPWTLKQKELTDGLRGDEGGIVVVYHHDHDAERTLVWDYITGGNLKSTIEAIRADEDFVSCIDGVPLVALAIVRDEATIAGMLKYIQGVKFFLKWERVDASQEIPVNLPEIE
jgi:hypothetical protein